MYSSENKLPECLVDYRSHESKIRLARCLTNGTADPFLSLSSCYKTQSKTRYCGLATLAMTLNALQIDPSQLWKTKQRWYTENLLDTCRPLELVGKKGIVMEVFRCLALQNGAICEMIIPKDNEMNFIQFHKAVCFSCVSGHIADKNELYPTEFVEEPEGGQHNILTVAYDRYSLDMQGIAPGRGHYSPIGAYDKETDSVLVLDVARYKYPPHWVPIRLLFKAMLPIDPETGKSRGYFTLRKRKKNENICPPRDCDCDCFSKG